MGSEEEEKKADNSMADNSLETETDPFLCGRCNQASVYSAALPGCFVLAYLCQQRKCRYRQEQTGSADEPMTVRHSESCLISVATLLTPTICRLS